MSTDIKAVALQEVRVHTPDAPGRVIIDAFRKASRDFCRRTLAWRDEGTANTVAGTSTYQVYDPTTAVVVDIFAPRLDDQYTLTKKTLAGIVAVDAELPTKSDRPEYIYLNAGARNQVVLAGVPDAVYTLKLEAVLMPTEALATIDDDLWDRWGEAIISGTLARLMRMPNKQWSDLKLSDYHRNLFEMAVPEARSKAADGHMVGVHRKTAYGGL